MAKANYKQLYDYAKSITDTAKKRNKELQGTTNEDLEKQISNKETRIKASGVDPDTDSRNGLEKLLGLPENQNFILDFFDLLGRPQQALFGAINAAQKGEDVGKAARKGFGGVERTSFKDILTEAGMEDRKGKLDLVDILGFGGDVFLDPADLIPVAGFSKASKLLDEGKSLKEASRALKSTSDLAFQGAGKAIKKTAKTTDNLLEKGLKKADEISGITYKTPLSKTAANLGKEVGENATRKIGRLEAYKEAKEALTKSFSFAANIPKKTIEKLRKNNVDSVIAAEKLTPLYNKLDNALDEYAQKYVEKNGGDITKLKNELNDMLLDLKEYKNIKRDVTAGDVIREGLKGKLLNETIDDDGIKLLRNIADDVNSADLPYKLKIDKGEDGLIKFSGDWEKVMKEQRLDPDKLDEIISKKSTYTEKQQKRLDRIASKLENDADFKKLYDETENIFNEANKAINETFGVNLKLDDNSDYVRHAVNTENLEEYKKLVGDDNIKNDVMYGKTNTIGNTKTLREREFKNSVIEINNFYNTKIDELMPKLNKEQKKIAERIKKEGIFKNGLTDSFSSYLENVPKTIKNDVAFNTVMLDTVFNDYDELKKIEKQIEKATTNKDLEELNKLIAKKTEILDNGSVKILTKDDNLIPYNYKIIDKDTLENIASKASIIEKQTGTKTMSDFINKIKYSGNNIAVNKDLLNLIDISSNTKEVRAFSRVYDSLLNGFKKFKTLSAQFQLNNMIGNMSNEFLGGIGITAQAKLYPKAADVYQNGASLMKRKYAGEVLTKAENEIANIWENFTKAGFGDANKLGALDLADMPESLKKYFDGSKSFKDMSNVTKVKEFLPYINNKANNYVDTLSRLVTFMYGSENPTFLQRLGVQNAGDAVRKINFDASELTSFEKNTMKKIVPFYTFTKKNLAYQITNLSKNGKQYNKLMKSYNNLLRNTTDDNEENVADWLKNNMFIPLPGVGKDGSYKITRVSLPFGNLLDTVSDPLGSLVNLSTPLFKMPFELATNTSTYNGNEIEKFKGQRSSDLPFLTKKQEYLLGNLTGLDTPLKTISRIKQDGPIGAIAYDGSIDADKMRVNYEKLDKLETLMKQYEQKGYKFSTLNELKAANKNKKAETIMAQINKLKGLKENPYSYVKEKN